MTITLTNREFAMGAECGILRNIAAIIDHRSDANGFCDENGGWNVHIEGACGEVAVAKALGRFWSPTVNGFHAPDIGNHIQVRTRSRHDYDLLIRPNDNPAHVFVLATGLAPTFVVHGYLRGSDCRRDEWLKEHGGRRPAWFVPQSALHDINDLRHLGLDAEITS